MEFYMYTVKQATGTTQIVLKIYIFLFQSVFSNKAINVIHF